MLPWPQALTVPTFLASLQNIFLMGQKNEPPFPVMLPLGHDAEPAGSFPSQVAGDGTMHLLFFFFPIRRILLHLLSLNHVPAL